MLQSSVSSPSEATPLDFESFEDTLRNFGLGKYVQMLPKEQMDLESLVSMCVCVCICECVYVCVCDCLTTVCVLCLFTRGCVQRHSSRTWEYPWGLARRSCTCWRNGEGYDLSLIHIQMDSVIAHKHHVKFFPSVQNLWSNVPVYWIHCA